MLSVSTQRCEPNCRKMFYFALLRNPLKIPRSGYRNRWLSKFIQFFLSALHRYIRDRIFLKIRSVACTWIVMSLTDRQTDRQADKRRVKHNLFGGDKYSLWHSELFTIAYVISKVENVPKFEVCWLLTKW